MNPLWLTADNLRSFPTLDFQIPEGITAITGPNGAGKSTLLGVIELALFADGARDLAPAIGPFGDRLELELVFEHDGTIYRVRRSYSSAGRGKATLDLEWQMFEHDWQPISLETAAATQARIEDLVGLNRVTFNASVFLAQDNSAAFPEASPAERKAILGTILDPRGQWPRWAERARVESKALERTIAEDQARIGDREETAAQLPMLEEAREDASIEQAATQRALDDADETLAVAQAAQAANEAAAERHRAAQKALQALSQERNRAASALTEAEDLAGRLPAGREKLRNAEAHAARIPELERLAEEQRTAALRAEAVRKQLEEAQTAAKRQRDRVLELERQYTDADDKHDTLTMTLRQFAGDGTSTPARCDRCEQAVVGQARQTALESVRRELEGLTTSRSDLQVQISEAQRLADELQEEAAALTIPELDGWDYSRDLATARRAAESLSGLRVLLQATEDHASHIPTLKAVLHEVDTALGERASESAAVAEAVRDEALLAQAAERARAAQQARRTALDEARAQLVRVGEQIRFAEQARDEARRLRAQTAEGHKRLDTLRLAERACGRDGIPALIAEATVPQLEAEANRILERLPTASGTTFRVELRTQRALKTDASALRETLDILVSDRQSAREFLTFSGGERFRVSFALRWALAKLLAGRRGAESRLLVIDEPDGLDAGGMDGLAALLAEEAATFSKVLLVSHNPLLASAFEQVVEVESDGEVSRLVDVREGALA